MSNQKLFFIADTHFNHANVIKFEQRPFADLDEMHRHMIQAWNNRVQKQDLVYICGDFVWKGGEKGIEIASQLNGRKILIRGNHDVMGTEYAKMFEKILMYADIPVMLENGEIKRVILSHYFIPFYNGAKRKAIMLHGHTHATEEHFHEEEIKKYLNSNGIRCEAYNVGAVHQNWEPWTLDEILTAHKKN